MKDVIKKEMLLQFKLEDIISILPARCNCQAFGGITIDSDLNLNVDICPNCFLNGSTITLNFNIESIIVQFNATEIMQPVCRGSSFSVSGTGNLFEDVEGSTFNGNVNFTLDIGPGLIIILTFTGSGTIPIPDIAFVGINIPVTACNGTDSQPLRQIPAAIGNKKFTVTLSLANGAKQTIDF